MTEETMRALARELDRWGAGNATAYHSAADLARELRIAAQHYRNVMERHPNEG